MNIIDMMFDRESIEEFEKLFIENRDVYDWEDLLHTCYIERRYLSVGGDAGYLENPPIDKEGIAYLDNMIEFLEDNNIKANKRFENAMYCHDYFAILRRYPKTLVKSRVFGFFMLKIRLFPNSPKMAIF